MSASRSGGRATDYADYPDGRAPYALRWPNYYCKRAWELAPAVRGNMYADCGREAPMPYTSGETPEVGDYVKNKWERPGTVTAVHVAMGGDQQVSIRWDDGGVDLPLTSAAEFTLLSRNTAVARVFDPPAILKQGSQSEERAVQEDGPATPVDRAIRYRVVPPMTAKTMTGLQLPALEGAGPST